MVECNFKHIFDFFFFFCSELQEFSLLEKMKEGLRHFRFDGKHFAIRKGHHFPYSSLR